MRSLGVWPGVAIGCLSLGLGEEMPDKLEINIKTLTPIWTGGVEAGKCDRIHETGILGSLRWWMEVLVRGVGGNVCDPTEHKCLYDPKKSNNGLCDICQIFGATGWKRRFRLEVKEDQMSDASIKHPMKANRSYIDKQGNQKTPTWYFPSPPKSGFFTIQIQSLHSGFKSEVIGGLIQFMADYSALGARPQMGFGVIEVGDTCITMQPLYDWLITIAGNKTYPDLPSLQNIFLAQITYKSSNPSFKEEDTFNLKYDLRQLFRADQNANENKDENGKSRPKKKGDGDKNLRHFIMGTVEDERIAAKIKISRAYEDGKLMRVWGWVPDKADVYKNGWSREKIVDAIYQHLAAHYMFDDWREMNSTRDTVKKNESNAQALLFSLFKLQEGN
jgi:CRISPR-associated protein Cmr1